MYFINKQTCKLFLNFSETVGKQNLEVCSVFPLQFGCIIISGFFFNATLLSEM